MNCCFDTGNNFKWNVINGESKGKNPSSTQYPVLSNHENGNGNRTMLETHLMSYVSVSAICHATNETNSNEVFNRYSVVVLGDFFSKYNLTQSVVQLNCSCSCSCVTRTMWVLSTSPFQFRFERNIYIFHHHFWNVRLTLCVLNFRQMMGKIIPIRNCS